MIGGLFYFSLFGKMSKTMPASNNLIYLCENQPWELAVTHFFGKKVKNIYGFAHSTIRYWDLRYFNSPRIYKDNSNTLFPFFCDLIVHGKNDLKNMTEFGFPKEKIKEAESLRFIYLNKYLSATTESKISNTFLVLGEFLRSDTKFMIDLLTSEKVKEVLENFKIIFKPHPLCFVKQSDFKDLDIEINFLDSGRLISQSDIIFTGNVSSVASEVITLGKQLICAKDLTLLDMSPLRGYADVSFAVDSDSFLKELRKITSAQKDIYQESILNLDESLKLWRNILKI
jgi:surface carbohydrate biosynthesis protein (TIGR04326 family)